jgi:hypothetical protein
MLFRRRIYMPEREKMRRALSQSQIREMQDSLHGAMLAANALRKENSVSIHRIPITL